MQSYRVMAVGDRSYREDGGVPADILSHRLTLNAFASGRRLVSQRYVSNGVVEPEVRRLLDDREVAHIHVRDTDAGCYDFCIERTSDEEGTDEIAASNGGSSHE